MSVSFCDITVLAQSLNRSFEFCTVITPAKISKTNLPWLDHSSLVHVLTGCSI